jgi:hypothetical protein
MDEGHKGRAALRPDWMGLMHGFYKDWGLFEFGF